MTRRPYVICHMAPSLDGRIVVDAWRLRRGLVSECERTAASFDADAWIIGRVSMAPTPARRRCRRAPGARGRARARPGA